MPDLLEHKPDSMSATITRPVVERIHDLVSDIPGWTPEDQLFALYLLAVSTGHLDGEIWEIGAWCGRSTAVLAMASRDSGLTTVNSIDLFPSRSDWFENPDGSFSFRVNIDGQAYESYREQTVWPEPFHKEVAPIYEQHGDDLQKVFTSIIQKKGYSDIVRSYRGTPQDFGRTYDAAVRFCFIDGDHGYDAVCRDIETVERFLVPGGWLALDDAFSSYEGVNRAIEDKLLKGNGYDSQRQLTRKCFAARRARGTR